MAMRNSLIVLKNFFIFNPTFGPREGEEEKKIMFYYPPDVDIDTKIKQVGLSQAFTTFTSTFTDKPCQSVHTQKSRQIFLEPEPEYWMVMTVTLPYREKTKDGQQYIDYREEDVQDSVYSAVLEQAYRMFKLFNGTFRNIVAAGGSVEVLKSRLDHFYTRYLPGLQMQGSDLLDVFNGIHFLPLDKNTFLRIQCFINRLEASFPCIKYTAFLFNDQLVWSGLEQDDMRTMYRYLITSLFPAHLDQEFHSSQGRPTVAPPASSHLGKFITGPPSMREVGNMGKIPHVFVHTEEENEECFLLVYKALSASICMLVNVQNPLTFELCRKLDDFLGSPLSRLASEISEICTRKVPSVGGADVQYKFIYFNHMNLAQKTTVHNDLKKQTGVTIPQETLKLLSDINADLARGNEDGETIVKTLSDYWVVGKKSDHREFYVMISQKNANLIEINEEVKKLCNAQFNSIFFLD